MISQKKGLKLSRHNSQAKVPLETPKELDDSLDDFVDKQSLRVLRKQVKNPATSADGSDSDNGSTLLRKNKSESRVFDSASSSSSSTVTVIGSPSASGFTQINTKAASAKKNTSLLCALCGRKFSDSEKKDRHVVKCAQSKNVDQKTLQKAEDLLERQMAERLSLGLDPGTGNQAKERRPRASNKKTDESDISLAMALSESLQMANEVARRQQEELLLQENLSEVVFELRQEEDASGGLAQVFLPPAPLTKIKKKSAEKAEKATKKATKNAPKEYVLLLRSQAERERMIGDRAAAILSQVRDEPPVRARDIPCQHLPVSEYLRRLHRPDRPLWQLAALNDADAPVTQFYVTALADALGPAQTRIDANLFNVSQLPGRNTSSQCVTMSSTQDVLEELAFKADGGFCEDAGEATTEAATAAAATAECGSNATSNLVADWSLFVDNPTLSDVQVRTQQKTVRAHRLVLAARCPDLLQWLDKETESRFVLNWSEFSETAVRTVLRFVYCARYQPGLEPSCHVDQSHRIARRHGLAELVGILEGHHQHLRGLSAVAEKSLVLHDDSALENDDETDAVAVKPNQVDSGTEKSSTEVVSLEDIRSEPQVEVLVKDHCEDPMEVVEQELAPEMECRVEDQIAARPHLLVSTRADDQMNEQMGAPPEVPAQIQVQQVADEVVAEDDMDCSIINETLASDSRPKTLSKPALDESNFSDRSSDSEDSVFIETVDPSPPKARALVVDDMHSEPAAECRSGRATTPDLFEDSTEDVEQLAVAEVDAVVDLTQESADDEEPPPPLTPSTSPPPPASSVDDNPNYWEYSYNHGDLNYMDDPVAEPVASPHREDPESPPPGSANGTPRTEVVSSPSSAVNDEELWPDLEPLDLEPAVPPSTKRLAATAASTGDIDLSPNPGKTHWPRTGAVGPFAMGCDHTPEPPRATKKRRIEVTPQPDYQTMDTPILQRELDKYGLKPLKRKNAVKLLQHIYEELHPMVTDSESSFQDTPERPAPPDTTSSDSDGASDLAEESLLVADYDEDLPPSQMCSQQQLLPPSAPLHQRVKEFLETRPDLQRSILRYEPLQFEVLHKELRSAGIRFKTRELLDWLDGECITFRMKSKRNAGGGGGGGGGGASPKSPSKTRRGCAKKLVP